MMTDLKILRKMTDLTQYELARESGVPRWKVSLIEAQQVEPSVAEEAAPSWSFGKELEEYCSQSSRGRPGVIETCFSCVISIPNSKGRPGKAATKE